MLFDLKNSARHLVALALSVMCIVLIILNVLNLI